VAPNEVVCLISFELRMGEVSGMMNFCIPYPVIEPVMSTFSTVQSWYSQSTKAQEIDEARDYLQSSISAAVLEVIAYVAETEISVKDLLQLSPGQMLVTEKPAGTPLMLTVGGKPKFLGRAGTYRGKKAFEIARQAKPEDRV
jgi:flagellar motor switch protein FliM